MATSYSDRAQVLEKLADSKRRAAGRTKRNPLKKLFLEEAARRYENAGRNWINEAKENKTYPRIVKYAKLNAINDYGLAKKIRQEIRGQLEKRIYGIASIVTLIGALFLVSLNVTGNSIGNIHGNDLSLLGLLLFVIGLAEFIFFKTRKK